MGVVMRIGRYAMIDGDSKRAIDWYSFSSKSEAETWIQSAIKIKGLDWRCGGLVKFKDGITVEIVKSKTGESVDWFNVKPK